MKKPETVQTEKHEKPKMKKKAVLSRLLPYLMRYKFLMLGAILLTVGGNLLSLAGPYISGLAVDAMELGRGKVNFEKVGCYGVLMVVMYAISAALSYALTRLMIVISRRVVNTMRHDVFQKLSELPVGYFDTHQTGDILSRISYDIDTINTSLTNDMVQVFASAVTVIGALIMMLSISPTLVLVFVFTVPLSMFMTKKITGFTRPLFRKRSAKLGELNGFVEEMISGQKTLRAYSQEENTIKKRKTKRTSVGYGMNSGRKYCRWKFLLTGILRVIYCRERTFPPIVSCPIGRRGKDSFWLFSANRV